MKLSELQPNTPFRVLLRDGSRALRMRLIEQRPGCPLCVYDLGTLKGKIVEITSNPDVEIVNEEAKAS